MLTCTLPCTLGYGLCCIPGESGLNNLLIGSLFHHVRDEVNDKVSEIPIRMLVTRGCTPTVGQAETMAMVSWDSPHSTSNGYDEQFLLGTVEALSDRLEEELNVMEYLIENVWYWRARLNVNSIENLRQGDVLIDVENLGHATTRNATLVQMTDSGEVLWGIDQLVQTQLQ